MGIKKSQIRCTLMVTPDIRVRRSLRFRTETRTMPLVFVPLPNEKKLGETGALYLT
jgi:hypothetical protein